MTEQEQKLLKVYNLTHKHIHNLYCLECIDNEFYDIDDELKIKLAEKLNQAYIKAHNDTPITEIANYMRWLTHEDNEERMTFEQVLNMNSRELGNDAFDYYYMSL